MFGSQPWLIAAYYVLHRLLVPRHPPVALTIPMYSALIPLLVGKRFQVLFHSPHRGTFHLSLTVLVHYRSLRSIQPWKMVLPDSHGVPRVPRYSGTRYAAVRFEVRDFHPLWPGFPACSPIQSRIAYAGPTTPAPRKRPVWANPISLAATLGISFDFFSSRYLDGSVPWVSLFISYIFRYEQLSSRQLGYPIRQSRDHRMFAPTPGFSQLTTTFFARWLQGIHRGPLFS
eukprot:TRINITY_DN235_c0_g1_i2.p1 TRINITY_DN235_c0_g1~~TRINITY_DN235_c0_g1_i2.p1  ORF type:complete len:229 (+),score=-36.38 TRINITY_DN235_c0_g1_i2:803-1489(+)